MVLSLVVVLQAMNAQTNAQSSAGGVGGAATTPLMLAASAAAGAAAQDALRSFVAVILSVPLLTLAVPRAVLRLVCAAGLWRPLLESFQMHRWCTRSA
jgi:hypothetical protein